MTASIQEPLALVHVAGMLYVTNTGRIFEVDAATGEAPPRDAKKELMRKVERLVIYPMLAILGLAAFGDLGRSRLRGERREVGRGAGLAGVRGGRARRPRRPEASEAGSGGAGAQLALTRSSSAPAPRARKEVGLLPLRPLGGFARPPAPRLRASGPAAPPPSVGARVAADESDGGWATHAPASRVPMRDCRVLRRREVSMGGRRTVQVTYYFSAIVDDDPDTAEMRVTAALAAEGFGVLTHIDVQATMKQKLDEDIPAYRILGACNPHFALQALQAEDKIGTMLPCNVIVRALPDGGTEIAAVDPIASMQAVRNEGLGAIAAEVRTRLRRVIESLAAE